MWSSAPAAGPSPMDEWLLLEWDAPQRLRTVHVGANRRRHRVHRPAEGAAPDALRVRVTATHGADRTHVVPVRAYA